MKLGMGGDGVCGVLFPRMRRRYVKREEGKEEEGVEEQEHEHELVQEEECFVVVRGVASVKQKRGRRRKAEAEATDICTVVLFDIKRKRVIKGVCNANNAGTVHVVNDVDGRDLLVVGHRNSIKVMDASPHTTPGADSVLPTLRVLVGKAGSITSMAVSLSSLSIVTGHSEGKMITWHSALAATGSGTQQHQIRPRVTQTQEHWHAHAVSSLAIAEDEGTVYSTGEEGVLVVWVQRSNQKRFLPRLGAPIAHVTRCAFDNLCAISTVDNVLRLVRTVDLHVNWQLQALAVEPCFDTQNYAHDIRLALEPRHGFVVCNGAPGQLQFFDFASDVHGQFVQALEVCPFTRVSRIESYTDTSVPLVHHWAFSHDGRHLVTTESREGEGIEAHGALRFWQLTDSAPSVSSDSSAATTTSAAAAAAAAVGAPVPASSRRSLPSTGAVGGPARRQYRLTSQVDGIAALNSCAMAFHPSDELCLVCASDGTIKMWALVATQVYSGSSASSSSRSRAQAMQLGWQCEYSLDFRNAPCQACAFSSDGTVFAVACHSTIGVWNTRSAQLMCTLLHNDSDCRADAQQGVQWLSFLSDGASLVSATGRGVTCWDVVHSDPRWHRSAHVMCLEPMLTSARSGQAHVCSLAMAFAASPMELEATFAEVPQSASIIPAASGGAGRTRRAGKSRRSRSSGAGSSASASSAAATASLNGRNRRRAAQDAAAAPENGNASDSDDSGEGAVAAEPNGHSADETAAGNGKKKNARAKKKHKNAQQPQEQQRKPPTGDADDDTSGSKVVHAVCLLDALTGQATMCWTVDSAVRSMVFQDVDERTSRLPSVLALKANQEVVGLYRLPRAARMGAGFQEEEAELLVEDTRAVARGAMVARELRGPTAAMLQQKAVTVQQAAANVVKEEERRMMREASRFDTEELLRHGTANTNLQRKDLPALQELFRTSTSALPPVADMFDAFMDVFVPSSSATLNGGLGAAAALTEDEDSDSSSDDDEAESDSEDTER